MARPLLNLQGAQVLVAVGRARSLRAAAAELAISPSALSRQLQALERALGAPLFDRTSGAIRLTPAGQRFTAEIEPALEALRQATARLQGVDGPFRIAASHSMTTEWLLPRVGKMAAALGFEVEILSGDPLAALNEGRADLAIKGGSPPPTDLELEPLVDAGVAHVVWAPQGSHGRATRRPTTDFAKLPLLAVNDTVSVWEDWLDANRIDRRDRPEVKRFDSQQICLEGAANGLGCALAFPLVSERFLESGRVVPYLPPVEVKALRYWLIRGRTGLRARRGQANGVRAWLMQEAAVSTARFAALAH